MTRIEVALMLVRGWTRAYTTGLDATTRESRLAEIDSDLWDQQQHSTVDGDPLGATPLEVFTRLLAGVPDDVAWRFEHAGSGRSRVMLGKNIRGNGWKRNALWLVSATLAVFCLASGVGIIVGGEFSNAAVQVLYGIAAMAAGLLIASGFVLTARRPHLGIWLIVAGCVLISAIFWWLFMIVPLVAAAVALFGISRARSVLREQHALAPTAA